MLIIAGIALIVLGVFVTYGDRMPLRLGRLPGDFRIEGKNGAFYFPLATCLLLSAVLTVVMWLWGRRP